MAHWAVKIGQQINPGFCGPQSVVGCRLAALSPYSEIFGVPIASIAFGFFVLSALSSLLVQIPRLGSERRTAVERVWLHLQAGSFLTSIFYLWIMYGVIGQFCQGCLGVHLANATLFGFRSLEWKNWASFKPRISYLSHGFFTLAFIASVASVTVLGTRPLLMTHERRYSASAEEFTPPQEDHYLVKLGRRGEEQRLTIAADLACPYCEELLKNLEEALSAAGKRASLTLLLYPMDRHCNEYAGAKEPGSCSAAKIAICRARDNRFDEFVHFSMKNPGSLVSNIDKAIWLAEADASLRPALKKCAESDATQAELKRLLAISADYRSKRPVSVVPTLWFRGQRITGSLSSDEWVKLFNLELQPSSRL